jgi:uncharacterized protein DUF2252
MSGLTSEAPARAVGRYQLDTEVGRLTPAERAARGKAARAQRKYVDKGLAEARTRDSMQELAKLTRTVDGRPRIISDPPLLVPIDELVPAQTGLDDRPRDFYVRQLRDWKFSGDRIAIAAYLGGSDVFDRAITRFAAAYADQNERDYQALTDAVKSGRITAEHGL